MTANNLRRLVLLPLLTALAISCKREPSSSTHPATESPIPAPPTLIAEGTLRDPDAFWHKLRKGSDGTLAQAADTAAGAVLGWAGVDPSMASLVAGGSPFYVALGEAPTGLAFAIAMKLGDLAAVRSALVEGETAPFRGEDVAGMIRLVPRQGVATSSPTVAVSWSGYLVIASTDDDLGTLGAYATRTLPTRPAPASSFELAMSPDALARTGKNAPKLAAKLTDALTDVARLLLPPEVDPGAFAACFAPGIRTNFEAAGDLAEARIDANANEGTLDVVAALVPQPGENSAQKRLSAIHPTNAAPLLETSAEALASLFWSDTADARIDDATSLGPCLGKALAPILGPGGSAKLADVMAAWAHGRGDWETASFVAKGPAAGLLVRAPVNDGAAVGSSLRDFAALAAQPSLADALHRLLPLRAGQTAGPTEVAAPASLQKVDVPGLGKASVLLFPSHAPSSRGDDATPGAMLAPPGLAWAADTKEADVALGRSPSELLAYARPTTSFRTRPPVANAIAALGADASFAAIFIPPGCCTGPNAASSPLTIAWGRHAAEGRGTLTIGDELLGQLGAQALAR